MNIDIADKIKKGLDDNLPIEKIKHQLIEAGHIEKDIDEAAEAMQKVIKKATSRSTKFIVKDIFDRIAYALTSAQFLNIFLFLIGGSFLFIGIINAFKAIFTTITSIIVKEYEKVKDIHRNTLGYSAAILALCFAFLAYAVHIESKWLFAVLLLISAIAVVPYGTLYHYMFKNTLKFERKKKVIGRLTYSGIFVTAITFVGAAYVLDRLGLGGQKITLMLGAPMEFILKGPTLVLIGAAVTVIISAYILHFLFWKEEEDKADVSLKDDVTIGFSNLTEFVTRLFKDKVIAALLITSIIISLAQTLGNTYYGIFIFTKMTHFGFHGWMNVAVVFVMGALATLLSPYLTKRMVWEYGKFPMLAFGTALMAVMPLSYYYKPTIVSISMGTIVGIVGSSINGVAAGLVIRDNLEKDDIKAFLQMSNIVMILPYLILVPLGALIAQKYGLQALFLILTIALLLAIPIYMTILVLHHKKAKV